MTDMLKHTSIMDIKVGVLAFMNQSYLCLLKLRQ
jgi:hypothetical protein